MCPKGTTPTRVPESLSSKCAGSEDSAKADSGQTTRPSQPPIHTQHVGLLGSSIRRYFNVFMQVKCGCHLRARSETTAADGKSQDALSEEKDSSLVALQTLKL